MVENIDIRKLVDEIHAAEAAQKEGRWRKWCEEQGHCLISKPSGRPYFHAVYESYVTGLYTLRAACRGKLHRKNPPHSLLQYAGHKDKPLEEIFFAKSYFYPFDFEGKWDAQKYNEHVAEKIAPRFQLSKKDMYIRKSKELLGLRKYHKCDDPPGADEILDELEALWDDLSQEERDELDGQPSMTWPREASA